MPGFPAFWKVKLKVNEVITTIGAQIPIAIYLCACLSSGPWKRARATGLGTRARWLTVCAPA